MVVEYSNHDSFSQAVQLLCPMGCGYKMLSLQVPSAPLSNHSLQRHLV